MRWFTPSWQAIVAILLCVLAGLLGPMTQTEMDALANPAAIPQPSSGLHVNSCSRSTFAQSNA